MNAARALLLPRGNPRRRMPLWLQRLKAADLLQAVREFPSFPIVVETYRDVLQDAFDLDGLRDVLSRLSSGALGMRQVPTELPSPFARSLQFGFVMDWMYGDDTPRAEARAALLSLDRALLDELMGGQGADETTLAVLDDVLARRRGVAHGWQARDADELAVLVDRAGDVTREELGARGAQRGMASRGSHPVASGQRAPRGRGARPGRRRFLLVDAWARYAAAFGEPLQLVFVPTTQDLSTNSRAGRRPAAEVIPEPLRQVALNESAARRDVLARYLALAGPVSIADIAARYAFDQDWLQRRLTNGSAPGPGARVVRAGTRCRAMDSPAPARGARRLELARARKQIEAVPLPAFARFVQRWQHLTPDPGSPARRNGGGAVATPWTLRPAAWERDYLPARIERTNPPGSAHRRERSACLGGGASDKPWRTRGCRGVRRRGAAVGGSGFSSGALVASGWRRRPKMAWVSPRRRCSMRCAGWARRSPATRRRDVVRPAAPA
jgi:ATP-dependent Lhr-like helicase